MIYFCQGCSAVFEYRVNHCPHCGTKQCYEDKCFYCGADYKKGDIECPDCGTVIKYDEDKIRYCLYCGYNLDLDGRKLDLKYCSGVDCGKEIGGLIRYSEETGGLLLLDEIFDKNNYEKEITDWLASIYNAVCDGYITCYDRMLYIYDQSEAYTYNNFITDFHDILENIFIHHIGDFVRLKEDENLDILSDTAKRYPENHNLCVIDIWDYDDGTDAHDIINECKGKHKPNIKSYYYEREYEFDVSFLFILRFLPEQTKIRTTYDKYISTVTPKVLKSLDIAKIWKSIARSHDEG
jgi:hypothetical protein